MDLSLDCLTLTDTSPAELIEAAAAAGFDRVSVWVQPPCAFARQWCGPAEERECVRRLADAGIAVHAAEVFDLVSEERVDSYRPALERGARLGARTALAIHAANADRSQVVDLLGRFVALANAAGLGVNVEPIAMARTRTLMEARDLIRDAGVDAGIVLDTYHLVRTGSGVNAIRAIEPGLIRHVQINDGPLAVAPDAMRAEARGERLYPGEGAFPLVELLRAVPRDVSWAIESPSLRRAAAGMTPQAQAIAAMAALRRIVAQVTTD